MPTVDVMDETCVVAPPSVLAAASAGPATWARWWPDLTLTVVADRGDEGIRWAVSGAWTGSMELWLEAVLDGTVVHYFLRMDPADPDAALSRRAARREADARHRAAKRIAFTLKDRIEGARPPGESPDGCSTVP